MLVPPRTQRISGRTSSIETGTGYALVDRHAGSPSGSITSQSPSARGRTTPLLWWSVAQFGGTAGAMQTHRCSHHSARVMESCIGAPSCSPCQDAVPRASAMAAGGSSIPSVASTSQPSARWPVQRHWMCRPCCAASHACRHCHGCGAHEHAQGWLPLRRRSWRLVAAAACSRLPRRTPRWRPCRTRRLVLPSGGLSCLSCGLAARPESVRQRRARSLWSAATPASTVMRTRWSGRMLRAARACCGAGSRALHLHMRVPAASPALGRRVAYGHWVVDETNPRA
mmetsp:Transcript_157693/g.278349  ORF Transcript_157693/g.278349 Transcript_157693/m.278349 type:complete len:283 (+) Transcript_157693:166-1014(+)